jgi:hypothetical protein
LRSDRDADPLLAASGMIDGLPGDLSERLVDEHLDATFVAERAVAHRAKTGPMRTRRSRR